VLSYPSAIDLSSRTPRFTADLLRRHRRRIGSRWRKLGPSRQALLVLVLVLVHLRCGDTYARLAAGFGVGVATVWRYVTELVDLLAAHAPGLAAAVQTAQGKAYVVLDGTLISIDRVGMRAKADRPYYSGKHMAVALIGLAGLILGWMISGSQRVNVKLTEDRRSAFATLLLAADAAHADSGMDRKALDAAATQAAYVCSERLRRSTLIPSLVTAVGSGAADWEQRRAAFIRVSRLESMFNAWFIRWWRRRWYETS
jgi:hypothetical protein